MTTKAVTATITAFALVAVAGFLAGRLFPPPPEPVAPPPPPPPPTHADHMKTQLRVLEQFRAHDRAGNVRSPFYFLWVAGLNKKFALKGYRSLKGLTIVEVGPGSSMIPGALYASAGAKHYYGVDIYQHPALFDALPYRTALGLAYTDPDYLVRSPDEIIVREENGKVTFNADYITFLQRQSYAIGVPAGSVDFLFSMASIEHLDEPEKTIAEWARVLKPGGLTAHVAAMADHRDFQKPYEYLKIDPAKWKAEFGPGRPHPAYEYVNQWRPIDFRRALEKAGFEILEYSTQPSSAYDREQAAEIYSIENQKISDADWAQIDPSVRNGRTRQEVAEVFINIVARKPVAPKVRAAR